MLERPDGIKWICSPPLRPAAIRDELWRGVADGRIALVSSDDAAYSWRAKLLGEARFDKCPNGIPGVEVRLPLLYSEGVAKGRITLERMVELVAAAPARVFGLAPRKGALAPGADADIVLFDPKARWRMGLETLHMAADWSAYEGIEVTGRIVKVFSRGELIVDGERFYGAKGAGRFRETESGRRTRLVTDPKTARVYSGASPEEVRRDLSPLLDWDDEGLDARELEAMIREKLVPHLMRYDSPGFQSMFNTVLEEGAALGARISLEYNQGVTNWQVSPGGATLEEMCGQGSLPALRVRARRRRDIHVRGNVCQPGSGLSRPPPGGRTARLRPGASSDSPVSESSPVPSSSLRPTPISRSVMPCRMLGLGEDGLVLVPVDRNLRMDADALRRTIAGLGPGRRAVCVVATAGTTSTGAVDPIGEIADICAEHGIWLHADGAYGLAYALTPECRALFAGVERADSAVWDPHKQAGVPIPNSVLFLRDGTDFRRMALHAAYFNRPGESAPDPGLKSPPSTRMFSALALAASLRRQGLTRFIERLRSPIKAVRGLVEALSAFPDIELRHRPDTGILCFRIVPEGVSADALDALQRFIRDRIMASGERTIGLTEIGGRTALRLVAVSPAVTSGALLETVEEARRLAKEFAP